MTWVTGEGDGDSEGLRRMRATARMTEGAGESKGECEDERGG